MDRLAFCELLRKLSKLKNACNEPCLIGGDFNDTLYQSEKLGGKRKKGSKAFLFDNCMDNIVLNNLSNIGPSWTWSNDRKGLANIKQKPDRFLVNKEWMNMFPRALSNNSGFYGSDHRAIKLSLNHRIWVAKDKVLKKYFIFENKWSLEEDFHNPPQKISSLWKTLIKLGESQGWKYQRKN